MNEQISVSEQNTSVEALKQAYRALNENIHL